MFYQLSRMRARNVFDLSEGTVMLIDRYEAVAVAVFAANIAYLVAVVIPRIDFAIAVLDQTWRGM